MAFTVDPKIQQLMDQYYFTLQNLDKQLKEAKSAGRVLDYLNQQRDTIDNEIKTLNAFVKDWGDGNLIGYFDDGVDAAWKAYRAENIDVAKIGVNNAVVENLVDNMVTDLSSANNLLGRRIYDLVRSSGLEAIAMKQSTGGTIKQAQKLLSKILGEYGFDTIEYKGGRQVSIMAYAGMVARTTTREATNMGTLEQVKSLGPWDALVQVTESATTCEVCAAYEGRIYSVEGGNPEYPPLEDVFQNGYATIHPNCTHNVVPYVAKFDKNREANKAKSNAPYTLSDEAKAKVEAYKIQQKEKAAKYASKKAWEKAKAENPEGTPKTFAGWQSQKRAEKKAYEKAQLQKALVQAPPKAPKAAKVTGTAPEPEQKTGIIPEGAEPAFQVPKFMAPLDANSDIGAVRTRIAVVEKIFKDTSSTSSRYSMPSAACKDEIVTVLSKRLETNPDWDAWLKANNTTAYDETNALIHNWAITSGDNDAKAIALQMAVNDEFNLGATFDHFVGNGLQDAKDLYSNGMDKIYRPFIREQYNYTQEILKANNITSIPLFRGAALPDPDFVNQHNTEVTARLIDVKLQPASSFSTDISTATSFSGGAVRDEVSEIIYIEVPAERVLGSYRTGFGCYGEDEFVILGSKEPDTVNTLTRSSEIIANGGTVPAYQQGYLEEISGAKSPTFEAHLKDLHKATDNLKAVGFGG